MNILSKAPNIQPVTAIPLPKPQVHELPNGAKVYELRLGTQEILKIEWLFDAGRWYETKSLVSRATAQLLKSGVPSYNADDLADFFDFYGAKLKISDDFDIISIRLYCLTKHLEVLLPIVNEMLLQPLFDEQELQQFCTRNKQNLKLELQKNDVIAYRTFTELLYGSTHPYGYNSFPELYDQLTRNDLLEHHRLCYHGAGCKVIISGKTDDDIMALLHRYVAELPTAAKVLATNIAPLPTEIPATLRLPAAKTSTQASLRIGARMFDKKHPDYAGFYFVNTLLGGYFGARLMQNLREDKGYTYSIYASMETMRHSGYFYIYTDVNTDVKEAALSEIYYELERLQSELVSDEEMAMVRNYSLGMFLNAVDGVFNVSAAIRELVEEDLEYSFFDSLVQKTANITAAEVQAIAKKYFSRELLCEVVVG